MGVCTRSTATLLLLFSFSALTAISTSSYHETTLKVVDVSPVSLEDYSSATRGSKDALKCERVRVSGVSRFKLGSYANVFRITLAPSAEISERLHSRIVICFHHNASLGLCQCKKDDWKSVQKGLWSSAMSPYRNGFVDVKFVGDISGSVSVTVDEEAQVWRFLFLALGFFLLLLAPVISSWVPFYYSSSMAVGVLLVIVILLFQVCVFSHTCNISLLYRPPSKSLETPFTMATWEIVYC
ncbi:hypothetical protein RJ640_023395 [Escallonia rubra]|uniref:Transmembrane protein n=1 Tax=Escallonia rubra TaxID=112253 RepID=A0AA88R464_9ASTE|nr:hypothetical protein RJ640_023395 [Escallonia rubra]